MSVPKPSFGVNQNPRYLNSLTQRILLSPAEISNLGEPIALADQRTTVLEKFMG